MDGSLQQLLLFLRASQETVQHLREKYHVASSGNQFFSDLHSLGKVLYSMLAKEHGDGSTSSSNVNMRSKDDSEEPLGGLVLNFQNHRNGSCPTYHHSEFIDDDKPRLGIDIDVKSVAGLFDLSECHFKCDPRPQTNELWLTHWSSFCFLVDYDPDTDSGTARRLPRSELFRACGLLSGFD